MSKEGNTRWYIETLDDNTNQAVSRMRQGMGAYEKEWVLIKKRRVQRDIWECMHHDVRKLENSRKTQNFKFNVYVQEGNGPIRLAPGFLWHERKNKKIKKLIRRNKKQIAPQRVGTKR